MNDFAIKTYRYLRIGMVGVVVLLMVAVVIERLEVDCWQTSISGYYYTPVRAIFVGGLMAIGASLLAIKGRRGWEDISLNVAGMLAPVVAVIPTSDAGGCWSIEPSPLPKVDGELAGWVVANIDNNVRALFIAGIIGLVVGAIIAGLAKRDVLGAARAGSRDMRIGLVVTLVVLLVGLGLHLWWDGFNTRAHGFAAVLMFVALAIAVGSTARERRGRQDQRSFRLLYSVISVLMVAVGLVMLLFLRDWRHMVLALETVEIILFAVFWLAQTNEHWHETT